MRRKNRTNKSARSRFKITKSGKVMHRSHNIRHLRSSKSSRQIRSLLTPKQITGTFEKKILKLLGLR